MLRRTQGCLVRRKHGQKAWSPNTTSSGAAPTNGVTAQEALQIAYRPMPPAQTVEYEEDFGPSMIIHREFISAKNRTRMAANLTQLSYSDVELSKAREQLANVMNRERRGVLVGAGGAEGDRVFFNSDVDENSREVKSARYLFNERRMQFCDRFQTFFRDRIERQKTQLSSSAAKDGKGEVGSTAAGDVNIGEDNHFYFSLMEACAILHGCESNDARETYYRRFLGLDLDALEAESEALRARRADAAALNAQFDVNKRTDRNGGDKDRDGLLVAAAATQTAVERRKSSSAQPAKSSLDVVQDIIDALPPLFPSSISSKPESNAAETSQAPSSRSTTTTTAASDRAETNNPPSSAANMSETSTDSSASTAISSSSASPRVVSDDVAPLYRAYLAHARGESPVASYDVTTIGASAVLAERRRWRSLMEKVAAEEYHNLTAAELEDAYVLNQQLHTVKFFDLKVGDTVREIVQLLQRSSDGSGSGGRDAPTETSPTHPERRV